MKKKRNIKLISILTLSFLSFFMFQMEPKAVLQVHEYNGASAPSGVSGGTCSGLTNVLCRFGKGYNGIRVGIVYYDAATGKYTRYGKPVDVWDRPIFNGRTVLSSTWRSLKFENVITLESWMMRPGYNYAVNDKIGSYTVAHSSGYANHLKKYFMTSITEVNGKKQWPVIDEYLAAMGTSREALSKLGLKTDPKPGLKSSGFRLFIEPIKPYVYNSRHFVMTLTEAARMNIPMSIGTAWKEENSLLFTVWDDVGIKAPNSGQVYATGSYGKALTADPKLGLSLHIIDLNEVFRPECEYTDPTNFPATATATDRLCCTYYEENYQEILKAKGLLDFGLDEQTAKEILYSDYPNCRVENKCILSDLPTYTDKTFPTLEYCCETFEKQYKDDPDAMDYINDYCHEDPNKAVCSPEDYRVELNNPVSCTTSTTGKVNDIDDWTCIFDSINQSDSSPYSKFYLVEATAKNPYCSVFCREDIDYQFPSNNITVDAGKHFTVNNAVSMIANWEPINFKSKRECRTTSSLTDPVHVQLDVDDGYKEYYNAAKAYEAYMSSFKNNYNPYGNPSNGGFTKDGCRYTNVQKHVSYRTDSNGKRRKKTSYTYDIDCTELERLKENLRKAERTKTCINECDYETITLNGNKYKIGYNYLVSGKINFPKFIEDWNKYNDDVIENWEGWKINQQFDSNKDCHRIVYSCPSCNSDGECTTTHHTGKSCKTYAYYDSNNDGTPEKKTDSGRDSCSSDVPDWRGIANDYKEDYEEALEKRKQAEDYIWSCNDWNKFKETGDNTSLTSSEYAYSGSFSEFLQYDKFSPDLILNYNNDEWIYHYNDLLSKSLTKKDVSVNTTYYKYATATEAGYTYSSSLNEIFTNKYKINQGKEYPLGTVEYIYPVNEEARSEIEKEYTYKLPENQYQYILKPQGLSVSERPTDEDQKFIDLGYTNLPVHFMTPTGSYPINLIYNKFSEYENLEHKFDEIVFGKDRNKYQVYSCNYYVNNEIIECVDPPCENTDNPNPNPKTCEEKCGNDQECLNECNTCVDSCNGDKECIKEKCLKPENPENPYDPTTPGSGPLACILRCNGDRACIERCATCVGKQCVSCTGDYCDNWRGLTVIYRPISLEHPFPGIDGGTSDKDYRKAGSNWEEYRIPNTNEYLYITNNRNVTESEIYSSKVKPMYSFTLTPAIIMEIRNYNKNNSYDDFNMKCLEASDGRWEQCTSNFLRNKAGTGTDWQVQIGNDRAKSWVDWDRCGMSDNWDQCVLEDEGRQ